MTKIISFKRANNGEPFKWDVLNSALHPREECVIALEHNKTSNLEYVFDFGIMLKLLSPNTGTNLRWIGSIKYLVSVNDTMPFSQPLTEDVKESIRGMIKEILSEIFLNTNKLKETQPHIKNATYEPYTDADIKNIVDMMKIKQNPNLN